MSKTKAYILLAIILFLYSFGIILAKLASSFEFLSLDFIMYYGGFLIILIIYAFAWQQILKTIPLIIAYSGKAITLIMGMAWGALLFAESVKLNMVLGAMAIICGAILLVKDDA